MEKSGKLVDEQYKFLQDRLSTLVRELEELIDSVTPHAVRITEDGQTAMVAKISADLLPMVNAAAGEKPSGVSIAWNGLPEHALQAFVGFASDGSPLAHVFDQVGKEAAEVIRQRIADGIAQGENPRTVARSLQGVMGASYARMETICRTEMLRAHREAARQTYADNADVVTGYQRLCAGDSRVCAACWALHGTVYETDEIMPTHANCRCVMSPITPSWGDMLGPGYEDLPDTRPDVPTNDELFSRMSEEQQEEALGPGRYALWKDGKVSLSDMAVVSNDATWGPTARVATLEELQA